MGSKILLAEPITVLFNDYYFPASSLAQRLPDTVLLKLIFIITNKTVS